MRIYDERPQIRTAAERFWSFACNNIKHYDEPSRQQWADGTHARLKALDVETATIDDVQRACPDWCAVCPHPCGECGDAAYNLMELGNRWNRPLLLCEKCLGAALERLQANGTMRRGACDHWDYSREKDVCEGCGQTSAQIAQEKETKNMIAAEGNQDTPPDILRAVPPEQEQSIQDRLDAALEANALLKQENESLKGLTQHLQNELQSTARLASAQDDRILHAGAALGFHLAIQELELRRLRSQVAQQPTLPAVPA